MKLGEGFVLRRNRSRAKLQSAYVVSVSASYLHVRHIPSRVAHTPTLHHVSRQLCGPGRVLSPPPGSCWGRRVWRWGVSPLPRHLVLQKVSSQRRQRSMARPLVQPKPPPHSAAEAKPWGSLELGRRLTAPLDGRSRRPLGARRRIRASFSVQGAALGEPSRVLWEGDALRLLPGKRMRPVDSICCVFKGRALL